MSILAMEISYNYGHFVKNKVLPTSKSKNCYCSIKSHDTKEFRLRYRNIFGDMESCQKNPKRIMEINGDMHHIKNDLFPKKSKMTYIEDVYNIELFTQELLLLIEKTEYNERKVGNFTAFIYHQIWVKEAVTTLNIHDNIMSDKKIFHSRSDQWLNFMKKITLFFDFIQSK